MKKSELKISDSEIGDFMVIPKDTTELAPKPLTPKQEKKIDAIINKTIIYKCLHPEIVSERAETIHNLKDRFDFTIAQAERLHQYKPGGKIYEHITKQVLNPKSFINFKIPIPAVIENMKYSVEAAKRFLLKTDKASPLFIENNAQRIKIQMLLEEIFDEAEKIPAIMGIDGRIDYLICEKYRKRWQPNEYKPDNDKNPIHPETEIQKRIDQLRQAEPATNTKKIVVKFPANAFIKIFYDLLDLKTIKASKTDINRMICNNFACMEKGEIKDFGRDYVAKCLDPYINNKTGYENEKHSPHELINKKIVLEIVKNQPKK